LYVWNWDAARGSTGDVDGILRLGPSDEVGMETAFPDVVRMIS
jgi:hypothetical protein